MVAFSIWTHCGHKTFIKAVKSIYITSLEGVILLSQRGIYMDKQTKILTILNIITDILVTVVIIRKWLKK